MVTGPSLTYATRMEAWKTPFAVGMPIRASSAAKCS
jgi:hypothetical protein